MISDSLPATDRLARRKIALRFVLLIGVLSFFADFTYEGSRSILGPYLARAAPLLDLSSASRPSALSGPRAYVRSHSTRASKNSPIAISVCARSQCARWLSGSLATPFSSHDRASGYISRRRHAAPRLISSAASGSGDVLTARRNAATARL